MKKLLNKLFVLYVKYFINHPYCPTCKEKTSYTGHIRSIRSADLRKFNAIYFTCTEDKYGIFVYNDGGYRILGADEFEDMETN